MDSGLRRNAGLVAYGAVTGIPHLVTAAAVPVLTTTA
jgi:hypothetical protein